MSYRTSLAANVLKDGLLNELNTPSLVIDLPALEKNLASMAAFAAGQGVELRPHFKTHKCIEIARLQMAMGAKGIACVTIAEAAALSQAGIKDILITSPVVNPKGIERLMDLLDGPAVISVVVDHLDHVAALGRPLDGRALGVLIDVDLGQERTGITDPKDAVSIAEAIERTPGLFLKGLQGFAGQVQHVVDVGAREAAAQRAAAVLAGARDALLNAGHAVDIVSGSGTGAANTDVHLIYTELQVGSYVFMDADYAQLERRDNGLDFDLSLYALGTIVSANRAGRATIDVGVKAMALNGKIPTRLIGAAEGTRYEFAGDEHGRLHLPELLSLQIGDKLLLETSHCDPTVNLFSSYNVVTPDGLKVWPIVARH